MGNNDFLSRREFITRSGLILAGTAVGAAGMSTVGFQQPALASLGRGPTRSWIQRKPLKSPMTVT